jgi:hypothetical protein
MTTAHNEILISARLYELELLSKATSSAYGKGLPLVSGNANGASMTLREVLLMLQYEMPTQHCFDLRHEAR